MSRRHTRTTTTSRQDVASAPRPATQAVASRAAADARAASLGFGIAVDQLLAERATARAARPRDAAAAASPVAVPAEPVAITAEPIVTTFPVAGMTCRSCEVRIQRHVSKLPGVTRVTASAVRGRVEIESTKPIPKAAVARAIGAAGYEIGRTPWLSPDPNVWMTAIAGIVIVAAVAILASLTGLTDLASGAGDLAQGGIVVALLLGLAAGVSTCAALVGGLVLALSAAFESRRAADGSAATTSVVSRLRPALVFVGGRVGGYFVLGAALGAVGATVTMPPQVTAVLMIAVAVIMTILGTRLTGLSPRIATWAPTLPLGLGRSMGLTGESSGGYSDARAAALGAASFFLPCGFTQAVQVYALSTGSPLLAGSLLAVFALGTAPGLLALAGLPVVVPSSWRPTLMRVVGVVVIGFALVNGAAGLQLSGIALPGIGSVAAAEPPSGTIANGTQTVATTQNVDGYAPRNVSIYAGIPAKWTITSTSTSTCAAALVVPSLGIQKRLKTGANTIDLPAMPAGTVLRYSCAMGMYTGAITVVDRPAAPAGSGGTGASGGAGG